MEAKRTSEPEFSRCHCGMIDDVCSCASERRSAPLAEPYPEVPREVLRPARPPEKRGAISPRLREGAYTKPGADELIMEAVDTIDALVAALTLVEEEFSDNPPLGDGQCVILTNHQIAQINAALALARR